MIDPCDYSDPQSLARLGSSEHPPMVSINALHLVCALDMLRQYADYAAEMRKIGRGFEPDSGGFLPDATRLAIQSVLERAQANAIKG